LFASVCRNDRRQQPYSPHGNPVTDVFRNLTRKRLPPVKQASGDDVEPASPTWRSFLPCHRCFFSTRNLNDIYKPKISRVFLHIFFCFYFIDLPTTGLHIAFHFRSRALPPSLEVSHPSSLVYPSILAWRSASKERIDERHHCVRHSHPMTRHRGQKLLEPYRNKRHSHESSGSDAGDGDCVGGS
jgi:hypothetical protein